MIIRAWIQIIQLIFKVENVNVCKVHDYKTNSENNKTGYDQFQDCCKNGGSIGSMPTCSPRDLSSN